MPAKNLIYDDRQQARVMCHMCAETTVVDGITPAQWQAWIDGTFIQNAMPHLSPDDRELLISGTCPSCWETMFKENTDE